MAEPPPEYCCPVTHELFREPVVAPDGNTYEWSVLREVNARRPPGERARLPASRMAYSMCELHRNLALVAAIDRWRHENGAPVPETPTDYVTDDDEPSEPPESDDELSESDDDAYAQEPGSAEVVVAFLITASIRRYLRTIAAAVYRQTPTAQLVYLDELEQLRVLSAEHDAFDAVVDALESAPTTRTPDCSRLVLRAAARGFADPDARHVLHVFAVGGRGLSLMGLPDNVDALHANVLHDTRPLLRWPAFATYTQFDDHFDDVDRHLAVTSTPVAADIRIGHAVGEHLTQAIRRHQLQNATMDDVRLLARHAPGYFDATAADVASLLSALESNMMTGPASRMLAP